MKYTHQRNLLTIDNKILKFDGEIKQTIELNGQYLIIRLLVDKTLKTSRNVFCVSDKGEIVWQAPFVTWHTSFGSPYTNIALVDGMLEAYNGCGILYTFELETGKILKEKFIK